LHHPGLLAVIVSAALASSLFPGQHTASNQLPTTRRDYFQPGMQPGELSASIVHSGVCAGCHGFYDISVEPYSNWVASMMAQSARDPIFHAALAIANQDAAGAGELCLRCHAPGAWLAGRCIPPDGSALDQGSGDFDGVTCNLCHRLVDPYYDPGESPAEDQGILANMAYPPATEPHTAQYVVDPKDRRRGPFDLGLAFGWHEWLQSPYHRESMLCGTCHDVSNPVLERQLDGTWKAGPFNAAHPTHDKRDEFPAERTFSEWKKSVFARAEIDVGGRFGGEKSAVATCQDCHLPDKVGTACLPGLGVTRRDMPLHELAGANSWVLRAVRALYPDNETGLDAGLVDLGIGRNISMLQRAADLDVFEDAGEIVVRVVNRTGHKLPTGYAEGRRMWLEVRFLDALGGLIEEHGHYDDTTGALDGASTRVWEVQHGIDRAMSQLTGLPTGSSFHFVLNDTIELDDRIPPRGFTNADFEEIESPVVGATYLDEQCWDDVRFALPAGTATVEVRLFHQTTTKEYIEFLRDENTTNHAGQVAWNMWDRFGKSAPVEMAGRTLDLAVGSCPTPVVYGLGLASVPGAFPSIGWQGTPSFAAGSFTLTLEKARPGEIAVLLEGDAPQSVPFAGGKILVALRHPIARATIRADGTASITLPVTSADVGTERCYQFLFRDPNAVQGIGLSDALLVDYCP
jgi:hypothetical protein